MRVPVRFVVLAALAAEVLATVLVAEAVGALYTFLWFVIAFILGVYVMRLAGVQAFRALRGANSRTPAVAGDSVLLFVAGLLLAIPGVLTDVVGLLLLLPPLRHLVRLWIVRYGAKRFPNIRSTFTTVRLADGSIVIPGEVVDDEGTAGGPPDPNRPQLP